MTEMNARAILLTEWIVVIAFVTYDELFKQERMPLPSRYVKSSLVYALLGLAAPLISDGLAAALGGGLLMALLYQEFTAEPGASAVEQGTSGGFDSTGGQVAPPKGSEKQVK